MAPSKITRTDRLKIIQQLLSGKEPKEVAFSFDVSTQTIYELRNKYLMQTWSLKRHPKTDFKLD